MHSRAEMLDLKFIVHKQSAFAVDHLWELVVALIRITAFFHINLAILLCIMHVWSPSFSSTRCFHPFVQPQLVKVVHIFLWAPKVHQTLSFPSSLFSFRNHTSHFLEMTPPYLTLLPFKFAAVLTTCAIPPSNSC